MQADLGYDSNIFATDSNEESDTLIRLAPAVEIECEQQQGVEIGFDPIGQRGRDGQPVTGEDFALMIDAVEQVMRGQAVGVMLPGVEQARSADEAR